MKLETSFEKSNRVPTVAGKKMERMKYGWKV